MPPQALEVEMAVLAAMIRDEEAVKLCLEEVGADDFYKPAHRRVFNAIKSLSERGEPIDLVTVTDELENTGNLDFVGGRPAMIDIVDCVFTAANAPYHARIVREKAVLRKMVDYGKKLVKKATEAPGELTDLLIDAEANLASIASHSNTSSRGYELICFADVVPEDVEWVWYGWIPKGKITFLEGKPGLGKSTLAAQIGAIVSNGHMLPDDEGVPTIPTPPAHVVIMCAEDTLPDIQLQRMMKSGANLERIHLLRPTKGKSLSFADLNPIKRAIEECNAGLLIIDPIQEYMGEKVDMNAANKTRPVLTKLLEMISDAHVGCIVIRHHRKMDSDDIIDMGMGSMDIAGIAHCILTVVPDHREPIPGETHGIVCLSKHKLTAAIPSIKYGITSDGFVWRGVDSRHVDEIIHEARQRKKPAQKQGTPVDEVVPWLEEILSEKDYMAPEIYSKARREGYSTRSVDAAKKELGVLVKRVGPKFFWTLPEIEEKPMRELRPLEESDLSDPPFGPSGY